MHLRLVTPKRSFLAALVFPLYLLLAGCSTQRDATAAAQQMASSFRTLQAYYRSLGELVDRTAEAQTAQGYLSNLPLDPESRALLRDTHAELQKRAEMAGTLARLAALFADITNSGAPAATAQAASELNSQLAGLKVMKANSSETEALKVATTALMNVIKAHDEVKAAKLIQPVMVALSSFFDSEAELYQSTADGYYIVAAANSQALIERNQVSSGFLYRSSLQPFGLSPEITDAALRKTSRADLQVRVTDRLADHRERDRAAVSDLSESLHSMRDRVARVANGKPLRATLPPLTLDGVKAWIDEVRSDLGVQ